MKIIPIEVLPGYGGKRGRPSIYAESVEEFLASDAYYAFIEYNKPANTITVAINAYTKRTGKPVRCVIRDGRPYLVRMEDQ